MIPEESVSIYFMKNIHPSFGESLFVVYMAFAAVLAFFLMLLYSTFAIVIKHITRYIG